MHKKRSKLPHEHSMLTCVKADNEAEDEQLTPQSFVSVGEKELSGLSIHSATHVHRNKSKAAKDSGME